MKKIISLAITAAVLLTFCACGSTAAKTTPTPAAATAAPTATAAPAATEDPAAAKQEAALTELLQSVSDDCHPGSAGCSLTGVKLAGQLLDWNAAAALSADQITETARTFYAGLSASAAKDFEDQIGLVYSSASKDLQGDSAKDAMDSAGYTPTAYPWAAADMTALFTALYAGFGLKLPAE